MKHVLQPELNMVYPVMEHFYTIQGEGAWSGSAAYFIRLGGCDVGCHWCDVKASWDASTHPMRSVDELVTQVNQTPAPIVVITGGEPTLHNLQCLTDGLKTTGRRIHLETAGTNPLTGSIDWICFSPKKFKNPLPPYFDQCHELKVVINHPSDLSWAEDLARQLNPLAKRYLQPQWERPESTRWIIDYVKLHPEWRISLQTHKFINVP